MILIIDDNASIREALSLLLQLHKYNTVSASTAESALNLMSQHNIQLVIQDMNFQANTTSGEEGRSLFYQLRSINPDIPIILMTAWTNLGMAVELVKAGAADYIGKPWEDDKLLVTIANLLQISNLQQENQRLKEQTFTQQQLKTELENKHNLCGTVFTSALMQRLVDMAIQVAPANVPVLITGPNGAGKEKIAEIVQANSRRKNKPFVKVNIGALPANLLEAELFGAEKGAYTGSDKRRIGRFEAAHQGTLFLDEMGTLSLEGQHKLLRVLQSGEFERLGSSQTQTVDVRIIAATNTNLHTAITAGHFRQDLYYRLNVVELKVPPLKDRKEDIVPLATHILEQLHPQRSYQLSQPIENALRSHNWPGNVRELHNVIQRACLLSQTTGLSVEDLGLPVSESTPVARQAGELSFDEIQQVLNTHGGVVARAARQLGISRQALYRRLEKKR